jgi:hypothetical protein
MTIHLKAKVEAGGKLVVDGVPFPVGEEVDVAISPTTSSTDEKRFPLRGKGPYKYDDPFSPAVPPEDWDAAWEQRVARGQQISREQFLENISASPDVPPIAGDEINS